jgi:hypothetical protein
MATRPERIHTRELLQHALYGFDDDTGSNTLEVFISRLRRKLGHVRHNAERANDGLALSIVGAIVQKHRALLTLSHASCCGPRLSA